MRKFFFYTFAINVIIGIIAAFLWLPSLFGVFGYLVAVIYTGLVILGANTFTEEIKR